MRFILFNVLDVLNIVLYYRQQCIEGKLLINYK